MCLRGHDIVVCAVHSMITLYASDLVSVKLLICVWELDWNDFVYKIIPILLSWLKIYLTDIVTSLY